MAEPALSHFIRRPLQHPAAEAAAPVDAAMQGRDTVGIGNGTNGMMVGSIGPPMEMMGDT